MRKLMENNTGSIVPIIYFILAIISVGALYTFFFIEFGLPQFESWIPASDSKTFIIMGIYGMPFIILVVGGISLLKAGLKREWGMP